MCAPFSQADQSANTYTAGDLAYDLGVATKRMDALARAVSEVAFEGKRLEEACGHATLSELRSFFEGSIEGLRAGLCLAMTGQEPARGNVPALVAAIREFTEGRAIAAGQRPIDPLATAMRRVDAVEAAEREAVARAHAVGASLLARLDAEHPYGKSAAPAAHGAHEAGFVSPAAA